MPAPPAWYSSRTSSPIPFLAAVESLKRDMPKKMVRLLEDRRFLLLTCFGIAYAAAGDARASLIAVALASALFQMGTREALHGDFSFGYDALVGMHVDTAVERLRTISPSLHPERRDALDPHRVPGRIQLVADPEGSVVAYALG